MLFRFILKSRPLNLAPKFTTQVSHKYTVVMVRHGESEWNALNLFCGWVNVNLTERGRNEGTAAGKALKKEGYSFDKAYTSSLKRAHQTLQLTLKELCFEDIETVKSWRLNERHYGALTGMNKTKTVEKYGEKQVQIWRRSFDQPPPEMQPDHPNYAEIVEDPSYVEVPSDEFPKSESLKMTIARTMPLWDRKIAPDLRAGKKIIIVAHGNSLRGIVKTVENISDDDIVNLNLPTGIPFVYDLDDDFKSKETMKFLGDPETVKKAMEEVANQIKKK